MNFEISGMRRDTSLWGLPGWFASIDAGDVSASVSRLDGETHWYVDSLVGPGCFPHYCHGEGDRTVAKQVISDQEAIDDLDKAAGLFVVNEGVQLSLF